MSFVVTIPAKSVAETERPAGGITRKGERAGLDGIPALDVLGRRSLDGDHRACQVNDRLVPTGGFARRGQCLDVLCRETDRSRPSGLRKEHRRGIERQIAVGSASVEKSLPCWKYQLSLDSLGMMNCSASGGLP